MLFYLKVPPIKCTKTGKISALLRSSGLSARQRLQTARCFFLPRDIRTHFRLLNTKVMSGKSELRNLPDNGEVKESYQVSAISDREKVRWNRVSTSMVLFIAQ